MADSLSLWRDEVNAARLVDSALGECLEQSAQRFPDSEAVVYAAHEQVENVRWSYSRLNELSIALARAFLDEGYKPGDRIAVWAPNHPRWILVEYALAKAGIEIVALNPLYKRSELKFALEHARVKAVVHAREVGGELLRPLVESLRKDLPMLRGIYNLDEDTSRLLEAGERSTQQLAAIDPDACLMIQYTSGTTGLPKAARLSHRGVATTARNSYQAWGFGAGDRVCHGFPLFHVGGSGNSTPGAALVGACTLPLYIFKARRTLDILEHEACTGFIGVPSMLTAMLEEPGFNSRQLNSLKRIVVGGTSVPRSLIERCESEFGVEVINSYGQTESSGVSCSTGRGDPATVKALTSGRPMSGISIKLVDKNGTTVPRGSNGELLYRGPGTMLGYLDEIETGKSIDSDGWLHSGDLASMDENGNIRIVGRVKEMVIRGGENLSPAEIENYLSGHPDIAEVAVLGLPDARYGEELCAALIPVTGRQVDPEAIRQWCQSNLSRWKVPRYICCVDSLPKTASGKVQKFKLKESMLAHFNIREETT